MLRTVPIRSRFVFTLIVPLLGLAVLAVGGIRSDLAERARAARVHQLARFGADLEPVIHQLQDERSLSSNYLAVGRRTGAADLATERRAVDRVVAAYRTAVGGLRLGPGEAAVRDKLAALTGALGKLPIQRRTVDTSPITRADERISPSSHRTSAARRRRSPATSRTGLAPLARRWTSTPSRSAR